MDIGRYGILYVHNLHVDTYTVPSAYAISIPPLDQYSCGCTHTLDHVYGLDHGSEFIQSCEHSPYLYFVVSAGTFAPPDGITGLWARSRRGTRRPRSHSYGDEDP